MSVSVLFKTAAYRVCYRGAVFAGDETDPFIYIKVMRIDGLEYNGVGL